MQSHRENVKCEFWEIWTCERNQPLVEITIDFHVKIRIHMYHSNSEMRGITGLIRCWNIWMMEHWGSGAMGY